MKGGQGLISYIPTTVMRYKTRPSLAVPRCYGHQSLSGRGPTKPSLEAPCLSRRPDISFPHVPQDVSVGLSEPGERPPPSVPRQLSFPSSLITLSIRLLHNPKSVFHITRELLSAETRSPPLCGLFTLNVNSSTLENYFLIASFPNNS